MKVVSNTSPVLNLALVGRLGLLESLYGRILVPQAVADELASLESGRPALAGALRPEWIQVCPAHAHTAALVAQSELHSGEAEAIALALELGADLLLLDERMGRAVASGLGLRVTGVLGILLSAKAKGLLPAVGPALDALVAQAGFWVDAELYARILREADESATS